MSVFYVRFPILLSSFPWTFSLCSTELCRVNGYYNPQSYKAEHVLTSEYSTVHINTLTRISRQNSNRFDMTPHRYNTGYSKVINCFISKNSIQSLLPLLRRIIIISNIGMFYSVHKNYENVFRPVCISAVLIAFAVRLYACNNARTAKRVFTNSETEKC